MDMENDRCEKPRRVSTGAKWGGRIDPDCARRHSQSLGQSSAKGRNRMRDDPGRRASRDCLGSFELASATTIEAPNRRDFLFLATGAVGAVGVAALAWPLIDQMNPDASTLAMASTEVDIGAIPEGQIVTVKWRGGPVFIRHRTRKEIDEAQNVQLSELRDPQTDQSRVQKPEWLIVVGVCTHLGCVPLGHDGKYDGWLCPCHGSVYDTSGRIRQGPAPLNLAVPEYAFLTDTRVKIG
jgi:ubiquinol-cytochrome c reductase iron-sulfur subunit